MRDLPFLIGEKRAVPDARGNWTPVPAYEGWSPSVPSRFPGHVRAVIFSGILAGVLRVVFG